MVNEYKYETICLKPYQYVIQFLWHGENLSLIQHCTALDVNIYIFKKYQLNRFFNSFYNKDKSPRLTASIFHPKDDQLNLFNYCTIISQHEYK